MPRFGRRRFKRRKYARRPRWSRKRRRFGRKKQGQGYRRSTGRVRTYGLGGPTQQIATRVQPNIKLKFVYNQTYTYDPSRQLPNTDKQFMQLIGFSCNQISDIHANGHLYGATVGNVWMPQNHVTPVQNIDSKGYIEWRERYKYGTVIGSKITVTAKTIAASGAGGGGIEPTLMFLHKTGSVAPQNVFNAATQGAEDVNVKPYVAKAHILSSNVTTGAKLTMGYSAKKFEGVKGHIIGNLGYREVLGKASAPASHAPPAEQSTWILGFCNARGVHHTPTIAASSTPPLLVQVKIEYIVALTEPRTTTNPDPMPAGMMPVPG